MMLTCETLEGRQTFSTLSDSESFRTQDGRLVLGHSTDKTQESYHTGILQDFICSRGPTNTRFALQSSRGGLGDETAGLITRLIGLNALTVDETENVLAILHAAFEKPEGIAPTARDPARTLQLLQHLLEFTDQNSLQLQIAETMAYVQSR
jgi:hypothetical protein